ncbi:hypothetical protein [Metabacillus litoralis]|uniref:hypothetical protein n=1 Tax=Metabacillus litoralis TaxID=152268 RepID=UPI001CFDE1ED|nr:hypothetical protein [Metabacillus litoralis]
MVGYFLKKFRGMILFLFIIMSGILLAGCLNDQGERMVLLDEKITKIVLSKSLGVGEMNQDELMNFEDSESIKVFERAIKTATRQKTSGKLSNPDYDIQVRYAEGLPTHAIHLWIGEEGDKSTLMYMVEKDGPYLTSIKMSTKLREIILSSKK